MKRAIFVVFVALSTFCQAATVPYKFNGMNVTREGGVTYLRGTSPSEVAAAGVTVSNHAINAAGAANWYVGTGALVQAGGVVFNAVVPVAATASTVAVAAVRANPAGLVTSAVASYLLSKGIDYVNGQFVKQGASGFGQSGTVYSAFGTGDTWTSDFAAACSDEVAAYNQYSGATWKAVSSAVVGGECKQTFNDGIPHGSWSPLSRTLNCPTGQVITSAGVCAVQSGTVPTDADWAAARTGYWSDPAILDLVKAGVPLPTDKAVFSPGYQDVPLSDPVLDPVTNKRMQDVARVTPRPSAPDTADVAITKREVDASGNPVIDPNTGSPSPAVEEKDLCKLNPDASGCKPLDEVPDIELSESTITLSINPVSGFGPDNGTCPADRTLFTKGGSPIVWSWGQYCTFASGIRPLIVGFAWLAALMIVVGVARRNS